MEVEMTLEVEIYGRNIDINERLEDYIDKKVSKLDRYLNNIEEARVDLSYVKSARNANDRQVAQITISGKGYILRAEERSDNIFTSIDAALSKMQRRISRYKGKRYRGRGDGKTVVDLVEVEEMEHKDTIERTPAIVRRKHFILHPMNELEAIEQMELLDHENFFIFYNANTNTINVLYKRRDGDYGLIEPEIL
jgi:putative sigma-54 modulation protein